MLFDLKEVDHVIEMVKNSLEEFKQGEMMRPYYLRGRATLIKLLQEISQDQLAHDYTEKYKEINIENTLKMLLRCKLQFHTRDLLVSIYCEITKYEVLARQLKEILV